MVSYISIIRKDTINLYLVQIDGRSCIKSVGRIENQHFIANKVIRKDKNRAAMWLPDLFLVVGHVSKELVNLTIK